MDRAIRSGVLDRVQGRFRWPAALLSVMVAVTATNMSLWAQAPRQSFPNLRPSPAPGPGVDTLWLLGGPEDRGGVSFGGIMDVAVDSSGRILVVDYLNQHVVILDQQGKQIGTLGRKGDGPGEFRLPFRASVAADGTIYVLDLYQGRVSEFDRQLKFSRSLLLQPMLTTQHFQVSGDRIVIAGAERLGDRSPEVLHQFDRAAGHRIRSFGRLLPARTPRLMYEVGAGPMLMGPGGETWYASPGPYRLELYGPMGNLIMSIDRPNDFLPPAENVFVTTEVDGRTYNSINRQARMESLSFGANGNLLLAVRTLDGRFVVDEYEVSGSGTNTKAQLRSSTIRPGPFLTPNRMVRPGVFVVNEQDEDGTASLLLVRVRPARLR